MAKFVPPCQPVDGACGPMLTGVYEFDREPTKHYIQRHGVEPPDDGFAKRLRDAPASIRAALEPEAPGRDLSRARARFAFDPDGSWRLLHFDLDLLDWIEWAAGEWREAGSSIRVTLQQLDGRQAMESSPLVLEVDNDRLLLDRGLAGSLHGLLGFRLVSSPPE